MISKIKVDKLRMGNEEMRACDRAVCGLCTKSVLYVRKREMKFREFCVEIQKKNVSICFDRTD